MHGGWRIGRLFGIPIAVHYSWLFIFGLVVWSLGSEYLPMHQHGATGAAAWAWAVVAALLFFASVLAHELAHSLVSRANGVPVEGITLFALGGVSELRRDAARPGVELVVAIVGPLASLVLAGLFALAWVALPPWTAPAPAVGSYLALGNAALGLFNLIPGFPLDGGRALRALAWARTGDVRRATRLAVRSGRAAAGALVVIGAWLTFGPADANGLWLILVGWFLWNAALQEGLRSSIEAALQGRTVATFVSARILLLDEALTVAEAVDRIAAAPPQPLYPVLGEGRLLGALRPQDVARLPAERWRATSVNWLARRAGAVPTLPLEADAMAALARLEELRTDALPVADGEGRLVGTFERGTVARWLESHALLGA